MDTNSIAEAVKKAGGQAALAAQIGVSQGAVGQWVSEARPMPAERCADVERVTGIPCEKLRPDIAWYRVTDPKWPWHPKGRPTVDLTRANEKAAA